MVKTDPDLNIHDSSNPNESFPKELSESNLILNNQSKSIPITRTQTKDTEKQDEGGTFLILMFYYFQDASIIHFKTIFVKADNLYISLVKDIVGGHFKFRIDIMRIVGNVCVLADVTPVVKLLLKLSFVAGVLLMLWLVFCSKQANR